MNESSVKTEVTTTIAGVTKPCAPNKRRSAAHADDSTRVSSRYVPRIHDDDPWTVSAIEPVVRPTVLSPLNPRARSSVITAAVLSICFNGNHK